MSALAPSLATLDAALAEATPALVDGDRRLVAALYDSLARGVPAQVAALARTAGVPTSTVAERLDTWPGVFRDDGDVVGFWGLAIPPMPHAIRFHHGAAVHAWCAWDPLFIAPLAGPATVTTTDPVSGAVLGYDVGPDGVDGDVDGQVLSFLEPTGRWDAEILTTFCHYVVHFAGRETGEVWVAEHPGTFLVTLEDAAEVGRRHADRLRAG